MEPVIHIYTPALKMEKLDANVHAESLLKWIRTFHLDECSTLQELSDGVAIGKALHQIEPDWFTKPWLSTINVNAAQNWRLRVSNLKKLLTKLMDYYQDCLGYQMNTFEPNITMIGEHSDTENLILLLQLVLGCAIHCSNKEEYIRKMRDMEEEVQQVIMQSIQDLEQGIQGDPRSGLHLENVAALSTADSLSEVTIHLSKAVEDLQRVTEERDHMKQRCHELDMQAVLLQDDKVSLQSEIKKLQDKLKDLEGLEETGGSNQRNTKDLKKQVDACKEELFKAETARDDYRAKVKQLEREVLEMQARQLELQQATEEARLLKDEVDILREAADKAAKHEATIESYKKKLEEYSDLKRRYKLLEDKNIEYMQSNMELEEEIKKSGTFKPQVEMYKKQVSELHQKLSDETKRADKVDFENRKLQEKFQALTREKERLVVERDQLKEKAEDLEGLRFSQLQQRSSSTEGEAAPTPSSTSPASTAPDNTDPITLQRANQRILELENQVSEVQEQLAAASHVSEENVGGATANLKQQLHLLQTQVQQLTTEKEQKINQMDEKDAMLLDYKQKIAAMHDIVNRKDAELNSREEKYKKCIEKAKTVIKSLDPKQSNGSSPEVADLRNQLQEKERIIENLEKEYEKNRGIREMEEKLMITAYNKFAVQLNRQASEQRLSHLSSSASASFLSRQRQPTNRRAPAQPSSPSSAFNTKRLQQRTVQDFEDMKVV
ncbi:hypothetical protein B566_EDAN001185 [Ephemera danica]|nr:hypothetical protein B566_EDAN001185 [Ephemera danica]